MGKILILSLCFILISCASIMHGTHQDIGISSTPSSASVTVDNHPLGKTPIIADLKRKYNHIVKIEMAGYLPFETTIICSVSWWVCGNVVFGGLIGLAVDAISGGLYKLTPEQIVGVLQKENISFLNQKDKIFIAVVLHPNQGWQKIGQLK